MAYVWGQSIKWIPGLEQAYAVTVDGKVASYVNRCGSPRWMRGQHKSGYLYFSIRKLERDKLCRKNPYLGFHEAVLMAWSGPKPIGMVGCHINSNKQCNHIYNLRWDTYQGNMVDTYPNSGISFYRGKYRLCSFIGSYNTMEEAVVARRELNKTLGRR